MSRHPSLVGAQNAVAFLTDRPSEVKLSANTASQSHKKLSNFEFTAALHYITNILRWPK